MSGTGRIGLLGGSFDPAHDGHLALSRIALARLRLDAVWWLVTPGNPLKPRAPAALDQRIAQARAVAGAARIHICAPEAAWGTVRTFDMLETLKRTRPKARFVWLMGSDNLAGFHRWHRWADIARTVPIAVVARPEQRARALLSPAARALSNRRLQGALAPRLPDAPPPAWVFLTGPLNEQSSTALRAEHRPAQNKRHITVGSQAALTQERQP